MKGDKYPETIVISQDMCDKKGNGTTIGTQFMAVGVTVSLVN